MADVIISGTNRLPEKMIDVNGDGSFYARLTTTQTSQLQTTNDLTKVIVAPIVTATTTTIVAAAASTKTRVYRMRIDVAGANVLTITDAIGGEKMNFTGAGFKILDFNTRPWYTTATNTALTITTTTTAEVNITCEFTRVA